jgi:hypothetical protein
VRWIDVEQHVGERVTLKGEAVDGAAGAVVVLEDGHVIYVNGLQSWPDDVAGREVEAAGTLVLRPSSKRRYVHKVLGDSYALESPTWAVRSH